MLEVHIIEKKYLYKNRKNIIHQQYVQKYKKIKIKLVVWDKNWMAYISRQCNVNLRNNLLKIWNC